MSIHHKDLNQQIVKEQKGQVFHQGTPVATEKDAVKEAFDHSRLQMTDTQTAVLTNAQQTGYAPAVLQIEDREAYRQQAVQGRSIEHVAQNAERQSDVAAQQASINTLTYNDFVRMIGTHNRGQVEFSNGALKIINNHAISRSKGTASVENRELRERFLAVASQKMGDQMTYELFERMRKTLGLDQGGDEALPLSREVIHDILADVNMRTSVVAKKLHQGSGADPLQYQFANAAHKLVAGKATAYERSHATSEKEKQFKEEVKGIFETARQLDKEIPSLTKHQLDNLVKGNLPLVRDEIYRSLQKTYQVLTNLSGGNMPDSSALTSRSKASCRIAAYTMLHMAAATEAGRALSEHALDDCIKETAILILNNAHLYNGFRKMKAGKLAVGGSEGLQQEVQTRTTKSRTLQKDPQRTQAGLEALRDLCDKMRSFDELQNRAFEEGLTEEEAGQMQKLGKQIQDILVAEKDAAAGQSDMGFVAEQLKGTRFANGYKEAIKLVEGKFSYKTAADHVVRAATCPEELRRQRQAEAQEEPVPEEENAGLTQRDIAFRLDMMEPRVRNVASVLFLTDRPSTFIEKSTDESVAEYRRLHDELRKLSKGDAQTDKLTISGVEFQLFRKENDLLEMLIDDMRFLLPVNAALIADALETDIVEHEECYGTQSIKEVIDRLEPKSNDMASWVRTRKLCLKVLTAKTGKPSDYFNNVPGNLVRRYAAYLLSGDMTAEEIITFLDKIEDKDQINGAETIELLAMTEAMEEKEREEKKEGNRTYRDRVIMAPPVVRVGETGQGADWSPKETKVKNLISDMVYSEETWKADHEQEHPGKRLQLMLEKHMDAMVLLVRHPEMVDGMLEKMPFPEGEAEMKNMIRGALTTLIAAFVLQSDVESLTDEDISEEIRQNLQEDSTLQELAVVDQMIGTGVSYGTSEIQKMINQSVDEVFAVEPEQEQEEVNAEDAKSADRLNRIMMESARGSSGQGLFTKLVLKNYFSNVPITDQRAMFASALRNSKPVQEPEEGQTPEQIQKAKEQQMGSYLSGILKGAGPLLQKMLQGMPTDIMPELLKEALKDMKSNLAPIPESIVKAQMRGMVERSNGKITQIEVTRALGAASVGQAFLCKVYGPGMPESGTNVVVKLLRPDVRNRMEREKKIMLDCASKTDENNGMLHTYMGQLERIKEELDLSIEARNVQEGRVYDKVTETVQSMKVSSLIEPTANSLVVECAPGTTVDKYLDDVRATRERAMTDLYTVENGAVRMIQKDGHEILHLTVTKENAHKLVKSRKELGRKLEQMQKRREYMAQLTQIWVTEGVFGAGFYHGDLHAGNIMVDDDGLTVIDFGNATKLTTEQQEEVTRMVAAAAVGDMQAFRTGFHRLIGKDSEGIYQEKRKELGDIFQEIFEMGGKEAVGQRIAVALLKAQELGLEVPAAIFNFSQCQIRLQNALEEMNSLIVALQRDIEALDEMDLQMGSVCTLQEQSIETPDGNGPVNLSLAPGMLALRDRKAFLDALRGYEEKGDEDSRLQRNYLNGIQNPCAKAEALIRQTYGDAVNVTRALKPEEHDLLDAAIQQLLNERVESPLLEYERYATAEEIAELKKEYVECVLHPLESEQRFEALMTRLKELENRDQPLWDTLHNSLESLRAVKNQPVNEADAAAHAEQIRQLEEQVYESYSALERADTMHTTFTTLRKMLRDPEKQIEVEAVLKQWFEDPEYSGPQLQEAYQAYRAAQVSKSEDLLQRERNFLQLYALAVDKQLREYQEVKNRHYDKRKPESFFSLMADVISENLVASLSRLGVITTWKYKDKLMA